MSFQTLQRNDLLDFYKGIAIILVILGHTFQYVFNPTDFDDALGFRLIYSFHMPLFILLSGMTASNWITKMHEPHSFDDLIKVSLARIQKTTIRLLIPFISWTIFKFWFLGLAGNLPEYLLRVMRSPDDSLWFLLCLYYCVIAIIVFQALVELCCKINLIKNLLVKSSAKRNSQAKLIIIFLIWLLIRHTISDEYGLSLLKQYFGFFIFGIFFELFLTQKINFWVSLIASLAFITLAPYWHRLEAYNLLIHPLDNLYIRALSKYFSLIVAISGSLMAISICKFIYEYGNRIFIKFISHCGKISLGVYAIQFYCIDSWPPVIAPLMISVIISSLILYIPVLKTVMLGEPFKKIARQ